MAVCNIKRHKIFEQSQRSLNYLEVPRCLIAASKQPPGAGTQLPSIFLPAFRESNLNHHEKMAS